MFANLSVPYSPYLLAEGLLCLPPVYRMRKDGGDSFCAERCVSDYCVFAGTVGMGVTGLFWAAPIADILAITITSVIMIRLWKELSRDEKASVL